MLPRAPVALALGLAAALAGANTDLTPGGRYLIRPWDPTNRPRAALEGDAAGLSPTLRRFTEASLLVQDGEYEKAIPILREILNQDPSIPGVWLDLGWSLWKIGRLDEAESLWRQYRTIAPRSPLPLNLLAQVALARNRLEEAESQLRSSLALQPDQFEPRFALALVLLWQGRCQEAAPLFEALASEEPERIDVRIEKAKNHTFLNEYAQADAEWRAVFEALPDPPAEYLRARAKILLAMGELEEAQQLAQKTAEQDGGETATILLLADIFHARGRPEETVAQWQSLLDRTSDPIARARLRERLAVLLRRLYKEDPAHFPLAHVIEQCQLALKEDPRFITLRLFLGETLALAGRHPEAETVFQTILEKENPHNTRAKRGLFEALLAQGRLEEARRALENLYRHEAGNPYRFADSARLEFAAGDTAAAYTLLDRLESEAARGCVFLLQYEPLAANDWENAVSARRFRDHLLTLARNGFRFVTPEEIPALFKPPETVALPQRSAFGRWLSAWRQRLFPGRYPPASIASPHDRRPDRIVCVTLDGGQRETFVLATAVALELDVPLTMFLPAGNQSRHDIAHASWNEIRAFASRNVWTFGSLGLEAHRPQPDTPKGYPVNPLPNRLWLPEKNRLETTPEWGRRIRAEFRDSRRLIAEQLGLRPADIHAIAYPLGDIGQLASLNHRDPPDVPSFLLNEASPYYRAGFLPDPFAYAMASDLPLVWRRHRPSPADEGPDVLRHALEHHPLLLARRLRAEMAALEGRPHLALHMLDLLERDGYPAELIRHLRRNAERRFRASQPPAAEFSPPRAGENFESLPTLLSFLGIEAWSRKANRSFWDQGLGTSGGLRLNPTLRLEAGLHGSSLEQEVVSNQWFLIRRQSTTTERTIEITQGDEGAEESDTTVTVIQSRDVYSNRISRTSYDAETFSAELALLKLFRDGSRLRLRGGARLFEQNGETKHSPFWGIAHSWKPSPLISLLSAYERSFVPSAREVLHEDAFSARADWQPRDRWSLSFYGRFSYTEDTNTLLHARLLSLWTLDARRAFSAGFEADIATADEKTDRYWTPYWEQRLLGLLRLVRQYPRFSASAEARLGMAREKGRPAELERWRAIAARGQKLGFDPGDPPGMDWTPAAGLGLSYNRRWGDRWEWSLTGQCAFFGEYSEYTLETRLLLLFR